MQPIVDGKLSDGLVGLPGKRLALETPESIILIKLIAQRAVTLTQQRFSNGNPCGYVTDTTVDLMS